MEKSWCNNFGPVDFDTGLKSDYVIILKCLYLKACIAYSLLYLNNLKKFYVINNTIITHNLKKSCDENDEVNKRKQEAESAVVDISKNDAILCRVEKCIS